jgi:hypothetical protein
MICCQAPWKIFPWRFCVVTLSVTGLARLLSNKLDKVEVGADLRARPGFAIMYVIV